MRCFNHPEIEAIATCVTCGKAICPECAVDMGGGRIRCQQCVAADIRATTPTYTVTPAPAATGSTTPVMAVIGLVCEILGLLSCLCLSLFTFMFCGGCGAASPLGLLGAVGGLLGYLSRKQSVEQNQGKQAEQWGQIVMWIGISEVIFAVLVAIITVVLAVLGVVAFGAASSFSQY